MVTHNRMAVALALLVTRFGVCAEPPSGGQAPTYQLAYRFTAGETVRWNVVHRATVRTTIQGVEQTARSRSESVKAWKVNQASPGGPFELVHSVESVRMSNQVSNRARVTYDSRKDKEPPPGFEQAAQNVGIPLTVVRIDAQGKVLQRDDQRPQNLVPHDTPIAIPLPTRRVAVGDAWNEPHELRLVGKDGTPRRIRTRRRFVLREVKRGVATIEASYQVLTPIRDPSIEAQLVQRVSKGVIRFDLDAGRILSQRMDVDKRVHDFAGPGALMHYVMRFTEELVDDTEHVAGRPRDNE